MIRAPRVGKRNIVAKSDEEWRPAVGYEGLYEVSNLGRIKSCPKYIPNLLTGGESLRQPKIMRASKDSKGHHHLVFTKDGVKKNVFVHHVVARAFLGPCPDGKQTLHQKDNKDDNKASSLYYGTTLENGRDRVVNGGSVRGEGHHAVILTERMARDIFALRGKMKPIEIAERFGTTVSAVSHIHHGWSWAHTTGLEPKRASILLKKT